MDGRKEAYYYKEDPGHFDAWTWAGPFKEVPK
jgi:hypothetical protein